MWTIRRVSTASSSMTLRARQRGTARIANNCLVVPAERAAKLFSVRCCVTKRCAADRDVLQAHARRLRPERLLESIFQRAGRPWPQVQNRKRLWGNAPAQLPVTRDRLNGGGVARGHALLQ